MCYFLPCDCGRCVHVKWEVKSCIYAHVCSSVYLHKWHAHYWEVASYFLIPYLLFILENLIILGLNLGLESRIENHLIFSSCSGNLETDHMLCLVQILTNVHLLAAIILLTHPYKHIIYLDDRIWWFHFLEVRGWK